MTNERSDRGDGRDAKGRWTKNTTGNPNGRPRNIPDLDMADLYNFSHFPMEITIGGEKQLMTRHEIVLFKMFEAASKGRITAIKYLLEKFGEADLSRESIQLTAEMWADRHDDDPSSVPMEAIRLMKRIVDSSGPKLSPIRAWQGGQRNQN